MTPAPPPELRGAMRGAMCPLSRGVTAPVSTRRFFLADFLRPKPSSLLLLLPSSLLLPLPPLPSSPSESVRSSLLLLSVEELSSRAGGT